MHEVHFRGTSIKERAMEVLSSTTDVTRFSWRHLAFIAPLILLHVACALVFVVGTSSVALVAFAGTSVIQIVGITMGYHRLLAHRSFKTSRLFRFILTLFGVLAGQNGPLWWVSHHRNHHRHTDQEQDTHSPRFGFFWSHMGWLFSPKYVRPRAHLVPDLERVTELRLLERYFYLFILGYALLLFSVGEVLRYISPTAETSGFQLVLWGSVVSTVCVYHIIWSANSFCHRYGSRRFPTPDNSRNNLIVALLTFGDGWHHNHHYCSFSARHGFRWWEIDINYALLRLLARLGLVWSLRLPPKRMLG
jgi:stearoyl-CoA desaturase (Delta-9 desaturase)